MNLVCNPGFSSCRRCRIFLNFENKSASVPHKPLRTRRGFRVLISPGLRGTGGVPGRVEVHLYICRGFKTKSCQQRKARRGGLPTGCLRAHPASCVIIRPNTFFTLPGAFTFASSRTVRPALLAAKPIYRPRINAIKIRDRVISGLDNAAAQHWLFTDFANHASRCAVPHFSHEDKSCLRSAASRKHNGSADCALRWCVNEMVMEGFITATNYRMTVFRTSVCVRMCVYGRARV